MTILSDEAVDYLDAYGLSPAEYIEEMASIGMPVGSACGCPDSRCAGSHHGVGEDCGCLAVFVAEIVAERHVRGSGT